MGYGPAQPRDLEATIRAADCDAVLAGTLQVEVRTGAVGQRASSWPRTSPAGFATLCTFA
jgi:hypothetical protein